jgi:TetR/AcrR family transcriptional repressor of nem operon
VPNLKESIIHESLRLFSKKGYMSTSISDILEMTGASKGGFYNHFESKEHLFFEVLGEAQRIWRKRVLFGLDEVESPLERIKRLLLNYRDRYLKDGDNFPGGCVFITFSVELDDQLPELCDAVNKGFSGLKRMLKRMLDEAMERGEIKTDLDTSALTEMLFASMIGASVSFGVDKSATILDGSINAVVAFLDSIKT